VDCAVALPDARAPAPSNIVAAIAPILLVRLFILDISVAGHGRYPSAQKRRQAAILPQRPRALRTMTGRCRAVA
jgi:hypothetical protein